MGKRLEWIEVDATEFPKININYKGKLFNSNNNYLAKDRSNRLSLCWKQESECEFLTFIDVCRVSEAPGFLYIK